MIPQTKAEEDENVGKDETTEEPAAPKGAGPPGSETREPEDQGRVPTREELEAAAEATRGAHGLGVTEATAATSALEEINRRFGSQNPFGTPRMSYTPRMTRGPLALVGVGRGQSPRPGFGAGQGRITGLNTPNLNRSPAGSLGGVLDPAFVSLYNPQNYHTLMAGGLLSSPMMVETRQRLQPGTRASRPWTRGVM